MAKLKLNLTPKSVASLKARPGEVQTEYRDGLQDGLVLRIGAGGTKTFIVRYRANGKHRRLKLGRFPSLSLADAREQARKHLAGAQAGEDPAQDRQLRRSVDATFAALATEVMASKAKKRARTLEEWQRILDVELLPVWGHLPAASITRRDVTQLVERIAKRAPTMGNRVLSLIKIIYNVALQRQFPTIEHNPAHLLEPPHEEVSRDRYLSRDEIKTVWKATELETPTMRALLRLLLLTGQRLGSVCAMRWDDIDESDVWTIPAAKFKGRRPHAVPLPRAARELLEELKPIAGQSEYVFPGRAGAREPHITGTNSAQRRVRERAQLEPWTVHDFRTTFRTWATRAAMPTDKRDPAGLGVAPHVADAVLGHKEGSLGFSRYTAEQTRYLLAEKRDALEKWGEFVARCVHTR